MDGTNHETTGEQPNLEAGGADAALLAACERFLTVYAECRRRVLAGEPDTDSTAFEAWGEQNYDPAIAAVHDISARTLAGVQAKAACLVEFFGDRAADGELAASLDGAVLSDSIWEVLEWLAERHIGAASAGADPDAALIEACERCCRAEAEWLRLIDVGDDDASAAAVQSFADGELTEAQEAVLNAGPATTPAGLAAKARVVANFYGPDWPTGSVVDSLMREVVIAVAERAPVAEAVL